MSTHFEKKGLNLNVGNLKKKVNYIIPVTVIGNDNNKIFMVRSSITYSKIMKGQICKVNYKILKIYEESI